MLRLSGYDTLVTTKVHSTVRTVCKMIENRPTVEMIAVEMYILAFFMNLDCRNSPYWGLGR